MPKARKPKLTPKQAAFALKYVECGNASEAYRHAYDVSETCKPETVWVEAHKVLANPNVAQRVIQLQEAHAKRHAVTVDSLTEELNKAQEIATQEGQAAAHVSATMGKAKLHGLAIDRSKVEHDVSDALAERLNRAKGRKK